MLLYSCSWIESDMNLWPDRLIVHLMHCTIHSLTHDSDSWLMAFVSTVRLWLWNYKCNLTATILFYINIQWLKCQKNHNLAHFQQFQGTHPFGSKLKWFGCWVLQRVVLLVGSHAIQDSVWGARRPPKKYVHLLSFFLMINWPPLIDLTYMMLHVT